MASKLVTLVIVAMSTRADAGAHFMFFTSSDCSGGDKYLFKTAVRHYASNPCARGYFEGAGGGGNHYLRSNCSATGVVVSVYNTTACSAGTNNLVKTFYIADKNFTTANGTLDNNKANYGTCVAYSNTSGGDAVGSVQLAKATTQDLDGLVAASPCPPPTTPPPTTPPTTNATNASATTPKVTVPKGNSGADAMHASFYVLLGLAMAVFSADELE